MNILIIFLWIYAAMLSMSFWEAYAEGRNAWDKGKQGWKIKIISHFTLTGYHFFLFAVMWPLVLSLPLITHGWDKQLFGILLSAYMSGVVIQDFGWYVVNPKVKLAEFWTEFSNYYPWLRIGKKKIIPWGYILGLLIAIASWFFIWK